ncbi:hypothetical protein AU210_010091 [Fusarium oxysporum f. sp. radicis-cucumerinum]|uniref:Xylanolytic transcriptional activator regulatory domain-containing protein n=1 Tax=Fusarium oxysporum f. sp. radicis-cucumerinum TaxID=327505 RepID=A0A2H3GZ33_FUSOX|nr:hypothetical protein FOMA001_g11576 [Fusarium oxysporum f. sp. matthiolae]KAK2476104.1 hypothetical protein H9L39_11328 [Fusarium oxysporum f. sp. albedinis]PCD30409.1 hypothetical protein AU210_010091 [Fusarium oxysporum f. sp. radicis-cucumerinum]
MSPATTDQSATHQKVAQSLLHVEGLINELLDQSAQGSRLEGKTSALPPCSLRFHPDSTPETPRWREIRPQLIRAPVQHEVSVSAPPVCGKDTDRRLSVAISNLPAPEPPSSQRETCSTSIADPSSSLPPTLSFVDTLNHHVQSLMPSLNSALVILRKAKVTYHPIQMMQSPGDFVQSSISYEPLAIPDPTAQPLLIARRLLEIALGLQHLHESNSSDKGISRLLKSAREASRRYVDAAIRYVTSQDLLVTSYDGLETLMLEGLYYINSGNLKLGWMAFRRAISIAQLLNLSLPSRNSGARYEPSDSPKSRFLWFRLNYADRFLSLMLGLPAATTDDSVASSEVMAAESPLGRLDRLHTVIMGRLIARNQRIAAADSTQALQSELEETQNMDQELKTIASLFPAEWWLSPHLTDFVTDTSTSDSSRLLAQVNHAHLLLILHLPYVLQSLSSQQPGETDNNMHNAVTASRDILSRYILYRKFNQVPTCCRAVDFKALTASATLLLAHLYGHRLDHASALAHQRLQDIGLVQMTIRSIEGLVKFSLDSQGETELRVLKWLQEAEGWAADGVVHSLCINESACGGECRIFEEGLNLEFAAPYLGRLRVNRLEESGEGAVEKLLTEHLGTMPENSSGGYGAWPLHDTGRVAVPSLTGFSVIDTMCDRVGSIHRSQIDTSLAASGSHEVLVPGTYTDSHTWEFQDLVPFEFSEG